jgi:hypothetical protein
MSSTRESRHSLDSRPSTPSSSTRGGIVPAGVGQSCPLLSLLLRVPADARRSLLPTPRIDGDLVNAHRAALGRYRDRRGRRRLRLLPPLLRSFSSIVFAPPDSSSRSSSSAPDDGPFCAPSSRCLSRPPSEDERSSRHRATIAAATMIPAVTVIGRRDGSGVIPPPRDDRGRGDDPGGHCHRTSGWEITPKRETAPRLPRSCSAAAPP